MASVTEPAQKRTPLYPEHLKLGARMIPFGDWVMPVQYSSILEEHLAVRQNVGVFDISHMGQLVASGPDTADWLNQMLTNNVNALELGAGQYTFLLNKEGGVIDDLILYRTGPDEFLLVVNASRVDEDLAWLDSHIVGAVDLKNRSADYAGLAIQGPNVVELFHSLLGSETGLPARNQIADLSLDGMPISIARTGYTGEDGVELFCRANDAPAVWNRVLEKGAALGIRPCGLGARDTLRLEMCYPLNGSDLSPEHNPIEAGLAFFVDLKKPVFIGRDALIHAKESGPPTKLVPFRMKTKGPPPRPHYNVFGNGDRIGETTSGTLSPSLNQGIGMAYLPIHYTRPGTEIEVEIRGQKFPAVIEKKPLFKKT